MAEDMRVFIFQQKVPRDGHGPVVIIAKDFYEAAGQLLERFKKKYPRIDKADAAAFLKNYSYRSRQLKPGIVLDHGI